MKKINILSRGKACLGEKDTNIMEIIVEIVKEKLCDSGIKV